MITQLEHTRTVTAPDGATWRVRRVLLPRGDQLQRPRADADGPRVGSSGWFEGLGDQPVALFDADARWILLIVGMALVGFVVLAPLLGLLVDLVIVAGAAIGAISARLLFRRPWRVEATAPDGGGARHSWGVVGTRASGEAVDAVATALAEGRPVGSIIAGVPI